MNQTPTQERRLPLAPAIVLTALVMAMASPPAGAVGPRSFKQRDRSEFEQGHPKGVSLSAEGPIRLGARLEPLFEPDLPYLWAIAADGRGPIYAAGGNEGVIHRFENKKDAAPFFRVEEPEVQSLAVDSSGAVYAGTAPSGRIYKINPDGRQVWVCETGEKYVWALVVDRKGGLYAATGNEGRILKIDASGVSRVHFDSAETHIRVLALDARGELLAGTDGHGLVFRIDGAGTGTVLYDAPLSEVAAMAVGADGTIYAAVTGEAGRGSRPSQPRPPSPPPTPPQSEPTDGSAPPQQTQQQAPESAQASSLPEPRGGPGMEGRVLAIASDGYAREIWSGNQEAILSLAFGTGGELLMGSSSEGRIYAVDLRGGVSEIARSSSSQVTALLRRAAASRGPEEVLVAGSNPGSVQVLRPGYLGEGIFESKVFDAQALATWGRAAWRTDLPPDTSMILQVRSGNTEDPDRIWSEWGAEMTNPLGSPVGAPAARYVQWRAVLRTRDAARTPELREVSLVYMQRNLPPEFRKVEVLPPGIGMQKIPGSPGGPGGDVKPGAGDSDPVARKRPRPQSRRGPEPGARSITWQVGDPNDDDLVYDVQYRALEEKVWKTVRRGIDEDFVTFDGASLPDGTYLVRIVASDAPSNPEGQALTAEKMSATFDVDNTPPRIEKLRAQSGKTGLKVAFTAEDGFSVLRDAAYSVDAGEWIQARPADGLSDALAESYEISLPPPQSGEHSIVVRATDAAGNVGSGRTVVETP